MEKLSALADGTTFIPLSSKICASSREEYFFVPFVSTEAVSSAVPGIVSVNFPPFENMLIATMSLTLFGVRRRVAPFESSYFCVFSFSLISFAGCEFFSVTFEICTSLSELGKTIDTALFFFAEILICSPFYIINCYFFYIVYVIFIIFYVISCNKCIPYFACNI